MGLRRLILAAQFRKRDDLRRIWNLVIGVEGVY